MKRIYHHRGHALDVSVEAVCRTQEGRTALDYVAVLLISSEETQQAPFASLRLDRAAGRVFASEAEALMGGYSVGRSIIDKLIDGGELSPEKIVSGTL
jgi:hypothetical protein